MSEVLFNILGVYYVLFLEYPVSMESSLSINVVDRFYLKIVEVSAAQKGRGMNVKPKEKKNKRRSSIAFQNSCQNLRNT